MQERSLPVLDPEDRHLHLLHLRLPQLLTQKPNTDRLGLSGLQHGQHLGILDLHHLLIHSLLLHVHVLQLPPEETQTLQAGFEVYDVQLYNVLHVLAKGMDGFLPK